MNFVPLVSWLVKFISPSRASVMRLTTANPKPWPFDFVVNSGVNSFSWASFGMPFPVSSISIIKQFVFLSR